MLDRIKEFYGYMTDTDFAKFLGITPQVLSNWRSRNSFDAELLYKKCPDLNPSWLLCGEEPMVRSEILGKSYVGEGKNPLSLKRKIGYLKKEIQILSKADEIMSSSGDHIRKALKFLNENLKAAEDELENLLKGD